MIKSTQLKLLERKGLTSQRKRKAKPRKLPSCRHSLKFKMSQNHTFLFKTVNFSRKFSFFSTDFKIKRYDLFETNREAKKFLLLSRRNKSATTFSVGKFNLFFTWRI